MTGRDHSLLSAAVGVERQERLPWYRATWERWKQVAHAVGVVQTRFLMILMYCLFVLPLGFIIGKRQDRLRLKPPQGSLWIPHPESETSLEAARRQF